MDCDRLDNLNRDLRNVKRQLNALENQQIVMELNDQNWCSWRVEDETTRKIVRMMEEDRLKTISANLELQIRELVNAPAEDEKGNSDG